MEEDRLITCPDITQLCKVDSLLYSAASSTKFTHTLALYTIAHFRSCSRYRVKGGRFLFIAYTNGINLRPKTVTSLCMTLPMRLYLPALFELRILESGCPKVRFL